jgi:hypothetical protein
MNAAVFLSPLAVTYARTENLFSGEPWPPDGSDFWAVVTRDRKHTIWRRITHFPGSSTRRPKVNLVFPGRQTEGATEMTKQAAKQKEMEMTKQSTKGEKEMTKQTNALTPRATEVENIHAAAQEDAGFEKILKFKKGEYFVGEDEIALGTEYLAHTTAWTKSWIKFADGEVAERKMYRVALGEKPPEREDLDDLDKDNWPEGLDGKPADPWVYQYLLPLENLSNGEVVIFVTSSFGGRRAIADLCSAYVKRTKKTGCGQPIIKLSKTDMPTKKFGKVPRPLFEVISWDEEKAGDVEVMPPAKADISDEIPF